jgi:DNA-binding CsgD family transcriptional regulator
VADESDNALSLREREVLALLAEGASNKEIARALALSIHTVKFHVAALTEKLGARSRGEAVAIAIRAGLVMV